MTRHIEVEFVPGLHRSTGLWGYCFSWNPWKPAVIVDPQVDWQKGGNALMVHEMTHATERHALIGLLFLLFVPLVGYVWWRRHAEIRADRAAFKMYPEEFWDFIHMHQHPKTIWGRFLYERSQESRFRRAADVA